ncbi:uncharacterized protein LOC111087344 [Limulus polyphemus]|uniref:Uncharacterized protein LOC111087344 n=1 Tax=Limulus polyphemus TaxID=6850 RepID=A0ABM1T0F3_LIMPO|nr:uncharacterized protein LOC111087344 [Limulus polyphemus]
MNYTNKSILENHMNIHRPQRQMYYCDICNKGFFWRTNVYSHKKMVHHTPPLRPSFPSTSSAPASPVSNPPVRSISHIGNPLAPHRTQTFTPRLPPVSGHMSQSSELLGNCAKLSQPCARTNTSPLPISSASQPCNNFGHSLIQHVKIPVSSTLAKSHSSTDLTCALGYSSLSQFPQPTDICSGPCPSMSPTIPSLSLSSAYSPVLRPPGGTAVSPAFSGQSQSAKSSSESSEYSHLYSVASPDFFSDS